MKLIGCIFALLLTMSAYSQSVDFSISGRWIRVEDAWQGMELDVVVIDDQVIGTLISVPDSARQAGFETGKIKWKTFQQVGPDTYDIMDLYSRDYGMGYHSFHYGRTHMLIISSNEIVMQVYNPAGVLIGAKQRWIKVPPM